MKFEKALMTMMLGTALAVSPAFAQEEAEQSQEVTVLALGSFVKSTTQNGIEQSTTNSAGVLTNYRYFFNRYSGVEANYAFTSDTQNYGAGGSLAAIDSRSHELSAAYVLRLPGKWISPFALAGAGGLMFDPKNFTGASTQAQRLCTGLAPTSICPNAYSCAPSIAAWYTTRRPSASRGWPAPTGSRIRPNQPLGLGFDSSAAFS